MFDEKIRQIIQSTYCGRVIVFSNYAVRQTLFSKGLTPAIFLHQFYQKKSLDNKIFYNIKEKGFKDLCDTFPIDAEQYEGFKQEKVNKLIRDKVSLNNKVKTSKDITKFDLINKQLCENYLRSLHFCWFEQASKIFLYSLTLDEENHKISTLQQPLGLTFLLEIEPNTNIKNQYEKLRKQSELKLKKMFSLNPSRLRALPALVVLVYNNNKKVTYNDALKSFQALRYQYKFDLNLICTVEINSINSRDVVDWSNYSRPIIKIDYKLQPSDPIRLLGENEENILKQYINNHREKIKLHLEERLLVLGKRYEEFNTTKNKFINFFKGSPQNERSYNAQQAQARQIADILFVLGDYKRSTQLYKTLAQKFEPNDRDQLIFYSVSQMIQLGKCLSILAPGTNNYANRVKAYESIQKHAEKNMLRKAAGIGKLKLHRYLLFIVYFVHCFKIFEKEFLKNSFYYYVKKMVNQQPYTPNGPFPSVIPSLIHEQYANMNLLMPIPQFRRYCYDLVRVASKFYEYKLHSHHLRCLLLANNIYQDTFPFIERYLNLSLSKTYLEMKNSRETIARYVHTWTVLLKNHADSPNNSQEDSQFTKLEANYSKLLSEVEKFDPEQLEKQIQECIPIPTIKNMSIEVVDEVLVSTQSRGSSWQEVGDIFLQKPQLTSKGMNKQNMLKMLKMFDSASFQQKELAYRIKNLNLSNGLNEAVMKRNSRVAFVNQPIIFSFDMKNILPNSIQIQKIAIHLKCDKKCTIKIRNSEKDKYFIKPLQSITIVIEITPHETGLYEFSHISWKYAKLISIYRFDQPYESKSPLKSLYNKINVMEETGKIKVDIKHHNRHYEGQLTDIQFIFHNQGRQKIQQIYLAIDNQNIFGFKINKFDFTIAPGQIKSITLKIKIPLFGQLSKNNQHYWKCINKSIFLYKTGTVFRIFRAITIFNIYKIADIYNIACERISRNLHFLSFSIKYENDERLRQGLLKSLVIDGELEIKKVESNQFGLSIVQYFFFLRRNIKKDLQQYKFSTHGLQCADIIRDNQKSKLNVRQTGAAVYKQNQVKLYFLWSDHQKNFGIIDPKPIQITSTQSADHIKLPFNVKIMFDDEIEYDFQQNDFLELSIEFRIKNIFDPKDIVVCIDLIQNANNDFYWEGITQHILSLKYNEESRFKMKLILFRSGIYNIAKNIKYIISINKANSYTINHYQYENLYVLIKNKNTKPVEFDFFQQFETQPFKKSKVELHSDSLI